jgi:hypothetical protein
MMAETLHVHNTTDPMTTLRNEVQISKKETKAQRWGCPSSRWSRQWVVSMQEI